MIYNSQLIRYRDLSTYLRNLSIELIGMSVLAPRANYQIYFVVPVTSARRLRNVMGIGREISIYRSLAFLRLISGYEPSPSPSTIFYSKAKDPRSTPRRFDYKAQSACAVWARFGHVLNLFWIQRAHISFLSRPPFPYLSPTPTSNLIVQRWTPGYLETSDLARLLGDLLD